MERFILFNFSMKFNEIKSFGFIGNISKIFNILFCYHVYVSTGLGAVLCPIRLFAPSVVGIINITG